MSRLTNWEIGQDLIAISDLINDKVDELDAQTHGDLIKELERCQAQVGDLFDKYNDHSFGIFNTQHFKEKYKE